MGPKNSPPGRGTSLSMVMGGGDWRGDQEGYEVHLQGLCAIPYGKYFGGGYVGGGEGS